MATAGNWMPTGDTRVTGVIGDPVRHSLSPQILNAAFRVAGLDWVFVAFPVPAGQAARALEGMRALRIDGLSVTMPHKGDVAAAVDELSPAAAALGAVNCVVREGERLVGHNTDGDGFIEGLRSETGFDPAGKRCVVLGAGGAARAVVLALAGAGAAEVAVVNRTAANAQRAVALGAPVSRIGEQSEIPGAELVVNATSVGMSGVGPGQSDTPFDPGLLVPGQIVADLVYSPLVTPLVAAARSVGLTAINGLSMLVHQAGVAFELWTRQAAPLAAMADAVSAARPAPAAGVVSGPAASSRTGPG